MHTNFGFQKAIVYTHVLLYGVANMLGRRKKGEELRGGGGDKDEEKERERRRWNGNTKRPAR